MKYVKGVTSESFKSFSMHAGEGEGTGKEEGEEKRRMEGGRRNSIS